MYAFETWYLAALTALGFAVVVYPLITLLERWKPAAMDILIQRRQGEIRSSLMIVFIMMAVLITAYWGWLGPEWKYVIIAAVMAWGFGDAAAALVGKARGRRNFRIRGVDNAKTAEGTLAMYVTALIAILITFAVHKPAPLAYCLLTAVVAAVVSAVSELFSNRGMDTIIVPFCTAATISLMMDLYRVIGG